MDNIDHIYRIQENDKTEEYKWRLLNSVQLFISILCELIPSNEEYRSICKNEIYHIQNYNTCLNSEDFLGRLLSKSKWVIDWIRLNENRLYIPILKYGNATKWEEWETDGTELQCAMKFILQTLPDASRRVMTILAQKLSREIYECVERV